MLNRIQIPLQEKPVMPQVRTPRLTMTVEEMAEELHISLPVAYELTNREDFFPAFRIKTRKLIGRAQLERWIDEQCQKKGAV